MTVVGGDVEEGLSFNAMLKGATKMEGPKEALVGLKTEGVISPLPKKL